MDVITTFRLARVYFRIYGIIGLFIGIPEVAVAADDDVASGFYMMRSWTLIVAS